MENNIVDTANNSQIPEEGFAIGKLINDKYIIEAKRGEGGMGLTYLAHDSLNFNRKVIIKTIKKEFLNSDGESRFLKEGEALGRINHDGVVRLFDNGRDAETNLPFLVMEFVKGENLTYYIDQGQMEQKKVVEISRKIAFALNAAHQEGVLHRDLKPDNIMIVENDIENVRVKLIDFGVAKVQDSIIGETIVVGFSGTLPYASPEQLLGEQTIQGEVFSFAIIVYQMLTQKLPFQIRDARTSNEQFFEIKKLHSEGAIDPNNYRADLSSNLIAVLMKGLKENSEERYQTPLEFANALESALIDNPKETPIPIVDKSSLRKKLIPIIAVFSILAACLMGFVLWTKLNQTNPIVANSNTKPTVSPTVTNQPTETIFSYWFEVTPMKDNLVDGKVFTTPDKTKINIGDKFKLFVSREKESYFYIIEEQDGNFDIIFPNEEKNAKTISKGYIAKPNQAFWIVWAREKVEELEQKSTNNEKISAFLQKNKTNLEGKENSNKMDVKSTENLVVNKISF